MSSNHLYYNQVGKFQKKYKTMENSKKILNFLLKHLEERKAENISHIELKNQAAITDYIIFASGKSVKNIKSTADHLGLMLKHEMKHNASIEGLGGTSWVLIDAGCVIVHLFHPEAREQIRLEEFIRNKEQEED